MTQLARTPQPTTVLGKLVTQGDLSTMTVKEQFQYYVKMCDRYGLNPLTKPFDLLKQKGKISLYANRSCTDQLRQKNNVSVRITSREKIGDAFCVTAEASMMDSAGQIRTDSSIGAVPLVAFNGNPLVGEEYTNAMMKCETKAKRRVTLSICGLAMPDETETDSIPGAEKLEIDLSGLEDAIDESTAE